MSVAHTCIYDTDSCKYAKYEFGEPVTSKCKDCSRNPNIKKTKMEENSNNLKYENDKPTDSPSSVKISDTNLIWTAYYSPDEELRNNLKSVVASDMDIDEKINLILALCRQQMMIQIPTESSNPYNPPKIWYCTRESR